MRTMTETIEVRDTLAPLERLDLAKVATVGELVAAMRRCSFGARMLGGVTETLTAWVTDPDGDLPIILFDGDPLGTLAAQLKRMVGEGWFRVMMTPEDYVERSPLRNVRALVIGMIPERYERAYSAKIGEAIHVNQYGQARMGFVRDGYFKNVVFADPGFIVPVLSAVLAERTAGKRTYVTDLIRSLPSLPSELGGGLAWEVRRGAEVLREMTEDLNCTVFLTLSGAMTVAKMGFLVCDMIDRGMVHYIASTGALMAHGLVEGIGLRHYRYDPAHDDETLAAQKLNRITDTLEPEENLDHVEKVVGAVLDGFKGDNPIPPSTFHRAIGRYLNAHYPNQRGILKSAYLKEVPICVPAFVDSEIGNDVYVHNFRRKREGRPPVVLHAELDTALLVQTVTKAKRIGIFSIGGGVPRNNTQNVAPLIEIINARGAGEFPERKFFYGCRIDPTPLWYGSLSGCTYSEGGSWRKMDLQGGSFAEIHADATIVWPFILKYVMENRAH